MPNSKPAPTYMHQNLVNQHIPPNQPIPVTVTRYYFKDGRVIKRLYSANLKLNHTVSYYYNRQQYIIKQYIVHIPNIAPPYDKRPFYVIKKQPEAGHIPQHKSHKLLKLFPIEFFKDYLKQLNKRKIHCKCCHHRNESR